MIEAGGDAWLRPEGPNGRWRKVRVTGHHAVDGRHEAVIALEAYGLTWHARCPVERLEVRDD